MLVPTFLKIGQFRGKKNHPFSSIACDQTIERTLNRCIQKHALSDYYPKNEMFNNIFCAYRFENERWVGRNDVK